MKKSNYLDTLLEIINLPIEINEKIVNNIYSYSFKNSAELKEAVQNYPNNEEKYGDCKWWDVSYVTNMADMFNNSKFNGTISEWDVSNVTTMEYMFESSAFNGIISEWDVSNVTNMYGMFYDSQFNGTISEWDLSNVIQKY